MGDTAAAYSLVLLDRFSLDLSAAARGEGGDVSRGRFEPSGRRWTSRVWRRTRCSSTRPRRSAVADGGRRSARAGSPSAPRPAAATSRSLPTPSCGPRCVVRAAAPSERDEPGRLPRSSPRASSSRRRSLSWICGEPGTPDEGGGPRGRLRQFGFGEAAPRRSRNSSPTRTTRGAALSPRYVLLLGDATYDPKDYLKTGIKDRLPGVIGQDQLSLDRLRPGVRRA